MLPYYLIVGFNCIRMHKEVDSSFVKSSAPQLKHIVFSRWALNILLSNPVQELRTVRIR